jgi:hypothetical protein
MRRESAGETQRAATLTRRRHCPFILPYKIPRAITRSIGEIVAADTFTRNLVAKWPSDLRWR